MNIIPEREYAIISRPDEPSQWGGQVVSAANDTVYVSLLVEFTADGRWIKYKFINDNGYNHVIVAFDMCVKRNNRPLNEIKYMSRDDFTLQFFDILL